MGRPRRTASRASLLAAVVFAALAPIVLLAAQAVQARTPSRAHHHVVPLQHASRPSGSHQRPSKTVANKASGDPAVTIADFSFTPGAITIHVGETIVWTNNGPSDHTATANNGSFNTGVLQKGHSASVTFNTPGTFDYHCAIHPFMHGAVVVLGAAKPPPSTTTHSSSPSTPSTSPAAPSSNASGSAPGANTASATSSTTSGSQLPLTGVDVVAVVLIGLALTGSGLALRRLSRG